MADGDTLDGQNSDVEPEISNAVDADIDEDESSIKKYYDLIKF